MKTNVISSISLSKLINDYFRQIEPNNKFVYDRYDNLCELDNIPEGIPTYDISEIIKFINKANIELFVYRNSIESNTWIGVATRNKVRIAYWSGKFKSYDKAMDEYLYKLLASSL